MTILLTDRVWLKVKQLLQSLCQQYLHLLYYLNEYHLSDFRKCGIKLKVLSSTLKWHTKILILA